MKTVEMNWDPTDRQLRQFGLIALVVLPLLGWFWHLDGGVVQILAGVGLAAAASGWLYPRSLKYVFIGLSLLTLPIGLVVGELVLLVSFYGIFVPLGLMFRLMGRDVLQRRFEPAATTYWQPKPAPLGPASYLRQS